MQFRRLLLLIVFFELNCSYAVIYANRSDLLDVKSTPAPVIDLGPVCSGYQLTIQNKSDYLGKNMIFHWSGPSGFVSSQMEPVIRIEGTYTVWVEDSTGFSTPTDSRNVIFFRSLSPPILASDTLKYCDGKTAPPINVTGFTPYVDTLITYSDATLKVILRKDSHSPLYIDVASPAIYHYYFVRRDTDLCESKSDTLVIVKNPRPTISIVASDTFNCTITQIILDASSSSQGASYNFAWSGPGFVSGTATLKPKIEIPGTFKLTIVNIINGCNKTDSIVIHPFVTPATGFPKNNVTVCDTGSFDLYNLLNSYTPGGHWLDDDATGRITGGHYFSAANATEGFFNFTYKQDSINLNCRGGTAKCKFQLLGYKDPGKPKLAEICNTESAFSLFEALTGYDNGGTWKSALYSSFLSGNNFQSSGAAAGNYVFTYYFQPSGLCATDSTNVTIGVYAMKNTGTGTNQTICSAEPYNLFNALASADRGGIWTDVSSSGKLTDSIFAPMGIKGGDYSFSYTFSGTPCPVQPANITVTTDKVPPVIICNEKVNFPMTDFTASYIEADSSTKSKLLISVSDNCGKYKLYNSVNNDSTLTGARLENSLTSISWTAVDSARNQSTCETKIRFIAIPNIFTPNGDGHNDTWDFDIDKNNYPDATVLIYDRWGNKVWESDKGYHNKWDGGNAPVATYRYIILNGKEFIINGYVNLVR